MAEVTELLDRWREGDRRALDELMPLVYHELRTLAAHYLRTERINHTLQPTALVHEAYLRLTGARAADFRNRAHFYGAAAQSMRRVLVDSARKHRASKRGGADATISLAAAPDIGLAAPLDIMRLHDALTDLATEARAPARVVELRYFGGLSIEETAAVMDLSPATVKRHWAFARAWLFRAMSSPASPPSPKSN